MKSRWLFVILMVSFAASGEPLEWEKPVFPRGPLEGQPIDDSVARPAKQLTSEQAARYGAEPGDLMFGNYWYKGKFYIAHVPKDAVERVVVQSINFRQYKNLIRHMQLRFILKEGKGLTLYSQEDMSNTKPLHVGLRDVIYSSEAVSDQQKLATSPQRQSDGRVVLIRRFQDPIDSYASWVAPMKNQLTQIPLDILTSEERNRMLTEAVVNSEKDGYSRLYNWIHRTCVTDCFENIDAAKERKPLLGGLFKRLPYWIQTYLWLRGLRPEQGFEEMPTFNQERPELERDPWVREQLRAQIRETKQDRALQHQQRNARAEQRAKEGLGGKVVRVTRDTATGVAKVCYYAFLHLSGIVR